MRVSERAAGFAAVFGWGQAARATGLLHDIGKVSREFQSYIRDPGAQRGGDHSTAGAREAGRYGTPGRLLAAAIAGHHGGLPDGEDLRRRLDDAAHAISAYPGWEAEAGPLPTLADLCPARMPERGAHAGFMHAFLGRMLFSCLVDADFLETEAFYATARNEAVVRDGYTPLPALLDRLRHSLGRLHGQAGTSELNALRGRVLEHAVAKAGMPPGPFTLTVPTGGGKTLTSLTFALEHAVRHGLRRVVYVIPYTSIIEQTAQVFRTALGTETDVLEHHASFDWDAGESDAQGADAMAKLRRAAENWDVPVVVTTGVQFFESLFANRPARCRKLHNVAGAVVVLDEVQLLPQHLLRPCVAAIGELARNFGTSVVLCTATQPALRCQDGFENGLDIPAERELAPDPRVLYAALRRVAVERCATPVDDATIAARFDQRPQMLCIVNSRAHAAELFERIHGMEGAAHLTTLMCPRHRRIVLTHLRKRLKDGLPVRLVATSLIEAGVDIDFPEVWRAMAGLDQIAQAAGRCNREGGRPELGRVLVFEPAERKAPKTMQALLPVTRSVLGRHDDPLGLAAVADYFGELYWVRGNPALDAARLNGRDYPILRAIAESANRLDFPFASIAQAFRMIDEAMPPVVVPWRETADDTRARDLLGRIAAMDRPRGADLRGLQQFVVPVPPKARAYWLALGALRPVHQRLGETLLCFQDDAHYDPQTGLRLSDPTWRSAEDNMF